MQERNHNELTPQALDEPTRRPTEPAGGVVRAWAWVLWVSTAGLWFLAMSFVGFSKPEHNDRDPVSAAAHNHQQNEAWADTLFWVLLIPPAAALVGALVAGREPPPGRRAVASGLAMSLSLVAMLVFSFIRSLENIQFTF